VTVVAPGTAAEPVPNIGALRQQFLLGMSHAACTVNVVTTDGSAGRHGVTVSAMVSVSADTPHPTLLVCIHYLSPVADALLQNGVFCVNVLREDQAHISDTFAGRSGVHGAAKFDCAEWTTQLTGAPRVMNALVAFDCRVTGSDRIGSHFVVLGSVEDIFVSGAGAPLIYANRAYGVPQRFHPRLAAEAGAAGTAEALALGCFPTFAPYIVPALVARLTKLHPKIELTLVEADQVKLVAGLRRNEIEVALMYDFDLGSDILVETMADLTPYVLLPDGHPLAESSALTLETLAQEPLVLLDIDPSRNYFLSLFRDCALTPRVGYRTGSIEMVRGLVGHGLGYSLLATKPANNMSYDGRALVTRPLTNTVMNSRLVLATLAGRSLGAAALEFVAHCRAFFHGVIHAHPNS
jgi:flavin reductase (DIM6/NTAB) family NADH-FMN oxidoreductase RutF/DNA-binding transcriptional LysR family regulator